MKKIVMNVPMHSGDAKSKAMKIAVGVRGVSSVIIGQENDRLVVIGEGVDPVSLAKPLRKKFCFAEIISVEDVEPSTPSTLSSPEPSPPPSPPIQYYPPPPRYYEHRVWVYDDPPPSNCSIL